MNWVRDQIKRHADADPEFRQAYVEDALRRFIAHQIRALREEKEWSQKDLGERMGKPQGNISRMEDPEYGKWSLASLFDLAGTFGVAPFFEFISHDEFISRTKDLGRAKLTEALFATKTTPVPEVVAPSIPDAPDPQTAFLAGEKLHLDVYAIGSLRKLQGEESSESAQRRRSLFGRRNEAGRYFAPRINRPSPDQPSLPIAALADRRHQRENLAALGS